MLDARGLTVAKTGTNAGDDRPFDAHPLPDANGRRAYVSAAAEHQVELMATNAHRWNIPFLGWDDERRGIVHVVVPELGAILLSCDHAVYCWEGIKSRPMPNWADYLLSPP